MNYSKIRPFLIAILVVGVAYNLYFYMEDVKMEGMVPQSFIVKEQYCRFSKGSSSIHIDHDGKNYIVRMANGDCLKYPIGSEIKLVYNERFDYFYKQDGLQKGAFRLLFFSFLLFLSLLPWSRFSNRKNN